MQVVHIHEEKCGIVAKNARFLLILTVQIWVLASALTGCVTLGKLPHLTKRQISHLQSGDRGSTS